MHELGIAMEVVDAVAARAAGARVKRVVLEVGALTAVLPDALFQEYCIADTPINNSLTNETLPIDGDGFLAVPTGPGLGISLDEDVMAKYRVD